MTEVERIADQLRRAHEGGAWHGPALEEILQGVNARAASRRTLADAHSIGEILVHIGVWESVVRRRLCGEMIKDLPPEKDWPPVTGLTDAVWAETLREFRSGYELLRQVMARLTDRQLDEPVPGMGYSVYDMLHGAVQHALYHAGQIALLKKSGP